MSVLANALASWRLHDGVKNGKLFFESPVSIHAEHIDRLAKILRETSPNDSIAIYVNEEPIDHLPWNRASDSIQRELRSPWPPSSISMTNRVVSVYLARAASAESRSNDPIHLGALWQVRNVFRAARWRTGTVLARYYPLILTGFATFLAGVGLFGSAPPLMWLVAVSAMSLISIVTIVIVLFRRVKVVLYRDGHVAGSNRMDRALETVVYPSILALILSGVPAFQDWLTTLL